MIKIISFFRIVILSSLISCSLFSEKGASLKGQGVNFAERGEVKKAPRIRESATPEFSGLGPEPIQIEGFQKRARDQKTPVLGVVLGPGLNRVAAHISLLRSFEQKRVPIRLISGSGMGALVAALYANGMTTEMIEWNFYKFFSSSRKLAPYSRKWIQAAEKVLLNHLKGKKIQNSKLSLIIPMYHRKERIVHYLKRGDLYDGLRGNLRLNRDEKEYAYSAPFEWEVYNKSELKKFGADLVVGIDVLGEELDLLSGDSFLIGVFGRVIGHSKKERESMDLFFEMPTQNIPLDSQEKLPELLQKSLEEGEVAALKVLEAIATWKEPHNREVEANTYQDYEEEQL